MSYEINIQIVPQRIYFQLFFSPVITFQASKKGYKQQYLLIEVVVEALENPY